MMLIQSRPLIKDHEHPGFPGALLTHSVFSTSSGWWLWWSVQPPPGFAPLHRPGHEQCGWNSVGREEGKDETNWSLNLGDRRDPSYPHEEIKVNQEMDGVFQVT